MKKYNKCSAYTFKHDEVKFLIVNTGEYYDVFAENQYQFGVVLDQSYGINSIDDVIDLVIANYENGNIYFEE